MTLEEAIKILSEPHPFMSTRQAKEMNEAKQLGIEALKREMFVRTHLKPSSIELLPGETKE